MVSLTKSIERYGKRYYTGSKKVLVMKNSRKHCGNESRVKNGYVRRKQRYKCKECGKTYREEDLRERYSNEQRLRVIKWIRKFSKILRQKLNETPIPENTKDIAILELVELFSYCQKN